MEISSQLFFNIVPFLLVLSVLVYVHEMGHYLAARINGIKVEAFSIGFGKEIFGWTNKHGTRWKFCWIPVGGYVKMHGESATDYQKSKKDSDSFVSKTPLQRIYVAAAGPFANYVYAIIMLIVLNITMGHRMPVSLTIKDVEQSSIAQRFGLQQGDVILSIDDNSPASMRNLQQAVSGITEHDINFEIMREGSKRTIRIASQPQEDKIKLGVKLAINYEYKKLSFFSSCQNALMYAVNFTAQTLSTLSNIITGKLSADGLAGPIGIANLTAQFAQQGIIALVWLSIILSLNLGLINLFPLPVLDGGHILFCFIEILKGKPVSEKAQEIAYKVGGYALLALFVFTTWKDINRLKIVQTILGFFN